MVVASVGVNGGGLVSSGRRSVWNKEKYDEFQVGFSFIPNEVHVPRLVHETSARLVDDWRGIGIVAVVFRCDTGFDSGNSYARVRVPAGVSAWSNCDFHEVDVGRALRLELSVVFVSLYLCVNVAEHHRSHQEGAR